MLDLLYGQELKVRISDEHSRERTHSYQSLKIIYQNQYNYENDQWYNVTQTQQKHIIDLFHAINENMLSIVPHEIEESKKFNDSLPGDLSYWVRSSTYSFLIVLEEGKRSTFTRLFTSQEIRSAICSRKSLIDSERNTQYQIDAILQDTVFNLYSSKWRLTAFTKDLSLAQFELIKWFRNAKIDQSPVWIRPGHSKNMNGSDTHDPAIYYELSEHNDIYLVRFTPVANE